MEVFLQYLDDLDDLVGAFGLVLERIRRVVVFAFATVAFFAALAGLLVVSLAKPPLALAIATLMGLSLLYHSVTRPHPVVRAA
jgi:hypothetical protein